MPTYEYHCAQCDKNFDVVQSFHDDPLSECPTCGAPVRKVFGNVGIVFKGSGFYKTDSRNGSKANKSAVGDSHGTSDSESKSSELKGPESTREGSSSGTEKLKPDTGGSTTKKDAPSTSAKKKPSEAGGARSA